MKFVLAPCFAGAFIVATSGAIAAAAPGESSTPSNKPLYAAFKTFCADTRAVPRAVIAAVKAAGGKPSDPPGISDRNDTLKNAPFPLTLTFLDVTVDGHAMLVSTGTAWPTKGRTNSKNNVSNFDSCDIISYENENASIAAIQKWIGVPPSDASPSSKKNAGRDQRSTGFAILYYNYQNVGRTHAKIKNNAALRSAEAEGRIWHLVLMRDSQSASLQFMHDLRPQQ